VFPTDVEIQFGITSRHGIRHLIPVFGVRCEVIDPNGVRSYHDEKGGLMSNALFPYPRDFEGAPEITSGRYIVLWLERDKKNPGRWRELLRTTQTVDLPVTKP
jgi:hypothetical protein